ncbi:MAG: alpha-L-arabinofuranosidase C-terminal domain-containing protein [Pirellulales bacterium]
MRYSVVLSVGVLLLAAPTLRGENLLSPVDQASTNGDTDSAWKTHVWTGDGRFDVVEGGRDGGKCLLMEADAPGGDISWIHSLDLEPGDEYRIAAWVKTENLVGSTGRGVVIHFDGDERPTKQLVGTNDWTLLETTFRPTRRDNQLHCTFGGWGLASGRVWLDDLRVEKVGAVESAEPADTKVTVTVDAAKPGSKINPFIYAQFIEHLGRCIYGGIWAEMLEDRKFYFPVNDEYSPYRDLKDSEYPVVGASPWEVTGPAGSVTMVKDGAFVGEHAPEVAAGSGIRQNDLGVVAGKKYDGYLWLKTPHGESKAKVSLIWGDGESEHETINIGGIGPEYKKFPCHFTAGASTDHARLAIEVAGAPCSVGTVSLMPADNVRGMRRDTLALLKQLNAPMYRWPGGNFVSGYNWRDGIGDRDRRPPRHNPAWTGVEHNDVGVDEFIDFCREVNAEPMIAANTGFGDDYSAGQEVEYCNGAANTIGGSWRANNGHAEPFGVKYWCVGNEMWGSWQLGFMRLDQYVLKHNLVAAAMRKADPNLVLVGSGDLGRGGNRSWSRGMLEHCADQVDLLSEHFYVRGTNDDIPRHTAQIVNAIRSKADGHRKLQAELPNLKGRVVPIAMDEWNYWYEPYEYGELGCVYRLRDALGIAAGLHEYFRQSDLIHMAHYAQTVNVIGCIKTTKTGAFFDTTALPLLLYRREFGTTPLAVSGNHSGASLDVAAARTEDGSAVTVGVVNSSDKPQSFQLDVAGLKLASTAKVWRITGEGNDPQAFNTVDKQPVAIHEETDVPFAGDVTVPPYSASIYRVAVEGAAAP